MKRQIESFEGRPIGIYRNGKGRIFISIYDIASALELRKERKYVIPFIIEKGIDNKDIIGIDWGASASDTVKQVMVTPLIAIEFAMSLPGKHLMITFIMKRFVSWVIDLVQSERDYLNDDEDVNISKFMDIEQPTLRNDTCADQRLERGEIYTTTQISKKHQMSATRLNRILESLGVQFKTNGQWVLHQRYEGKDYTRVKYFEKEDGSKIMHTYWTRKGVGFIEKMLQNTNSISEQLGLFEDN